MRVKYRITPVRSFTLLLILIAVPFCQANPLNGGIEWIADVDRAASESRRTDKPMLVKVSTDWCGYCKKMQRETFNTKQISNHVNQCFIPVYLDGDKHKSLVQQLGVRSYPTTLVVSAEGKVLSRITGFRTASQLSNDLNQICRHDGVSDESELAPIVTRAPNPQLLRSVFGEKCPVSPVETGQFATAKPHISTTFRGFAVGFASEQFRAAFAQNPAKYWPVADGLCIVSAAHGKGNEMGTLNNGVFYQGRIWFFANQNNRAAFEADPGKYHRWFQDQMQNVATAKQPTAR